VVWVISDVADAEIGRIRIGAPAQVSVRAFPGELFRGTVAFILPELHPDTRTAQVRIEIPNPGGRLIHRMYADVTVDTGSDESVVVIPVSAVIDSGNRQVAILDLGEGRFKPTELRLGRKGAGYIEVLDGVKAGDRIVTRANFLIDAESNLQAALTALSASDGGAQ